MIAYIKSVFPFLLVFICIHLKAQVITPISFPNHSDSIQIEKWLKIYQDPITKKVYRAYTTGKKRFYAWDKWNEEYFADGLIDEESNMYHFSGFRSVMFGIQNGYVLESFYREGHTIEYKLAFEKGKLSPVDSFYNVNGEDRRIPFSWTCEKIDLMEAWSDFDGIMTVGIKPVAPFDGELAKYFHSTSPHYRFQVKNCLTDSILIDKACSFDSLGFYADTMSVRDIFLYDSLVLCENRTIRHFPLITGLVAFSLNGEKLWERLSPSITGPQYSEQMTAFRPIFQQEKRLLVIPFSTRKYLNLDDPNSELGKYKSEIQFSLECLNARNGKKVWNADFLKNRATVDSADSQIIDLFQINENRFGVVIAAVKKNVSKGYRWSKNTNVEVHIFDFEGQFIEKYPFPEGERDYFKIKVRGNGFEAHTIKEKWAYELD